MSNIECGRVTAMDSDGDGTDNFEVTMSDNDGVLDVDDALPLDPNSYLIIIMMVVRMKMSKK